MTEFWGRKEPAFDSEWARYPVPFEVTPVDTYRENHPDWANERGGAELRVRARAGKKKIGTGRR